MDAVDAQSEPERLTSLDAPPDETRRVSPNGFVLYVTPFMIALVVMSAFRVAAWALAAPGFGTVQKPKVLFPSFPTGGNYPMLARERQQFFEILLVALLVGTLLLAPVVHRALRQIAPSAHRALLLACQLGFGTIALLALSRPTRRAVETLGWGWTRVLVGAALASGLATAHLFLTKRHRERRPTAARRACTCVLFVALAAAWTIYVASILETASSVKDTFNTGYVVNQLLAPSSSLHPFAGYGAAYTNLLGYVLVPFVRLGADPAGVAVAFVTICTFVVLGLLFVVFRRVGLSWLWTTLAVLLVTAVTSTSQFFIDFPTGSGRQRRILETTFSYHQIMPLRLVGPLVLGYLVVRGANRPTRNAARLLGFGAGLVVCNNWDFGSAAAAAAVSAAVLWTPALPTAAHTARTALTRTADCALGAAGAVILVLVSVGLVAHRLPDLPTATFYARTYSGNMISLPLVHAWDFHIVVIGTFVMGFFIAIAAWISSSQKSATQQREPRNAALIVALAYFSLFGVANIIYYLNRPVPPTLIGGAFFTWGVCLVLLGVGALRASPTTMRPLRTGGFVLAVTCCTAFAQVAFPPSFTAEMTRLRQGRAGGSAAITIIAEGPQCADHHDNAAQCAQNTETFIRSNEAPGTKVAIVAFWPNTLALYADVVSVTPFSGSEPTTFSELDLLLRRLRRPDHPDVFLDTRIPYPEVQRGIKDAGYVPVARTPEFLLLKWKPDR